MIAALNKTSINNQASAMTNQWKRGNHRVFWARKKLGLSHWGFLRFRVTKCFWGLCTLIFILLRVLMLRFPRCSYTCNIVFLRHKVERAKWVSQQMILVGDFNAHFDIVTDHFPEGHIAMLSRIPKLGTIRLVGQYKDWANTADRCY